MDNAINIKRNVLRIGSPVLDVPFGRISRQHNVATAEFGEYIDRVVRKYVKHQNEGDRFTVRVNRAEEGEGDLT